VLIVAALLVIALGIAHSVLGERYILVRLFRRNDLPKLFGDSTFTTRTLRFAWHITSLTWFGLAALLLQIDAGASSPPLLARTIGTTSLACAVLPLAYTRGKHLSWLVFVAIGVLTLWWAAR
jgi:hypothetical protein